MKQNREPGIEKLDREPSDHVGVAGSPADSTHQQRRIPRSESTVLADGQHGSSGVTRSATGPKTAAGKQRSSRNALKSGIFSKALLLKGESRVEYESVLSGLREHLQPQGTLESLIVEDLCCVIWRRLRLLRAENAEITFAAEFRKDDCRQAQFVEAWDQSRAGESAGGLLRLRSNPLVVQQGIQELEIFRELFERVGFQKDLDSGILTRLYGVAVPLGIPHWFRTLSAFATAALNGEEGAPSAEELKKTMVDILDKEIARLKLLGELEETRILRRQQYEAISALVPSRESMERLIRYEAHFSREFDRLLHRLECLQRMRLGQPGPPTVRLELND